jgi:heme exporter protein A
MADHAPLLRAQSVGRQFGYRNIFKGVNLELSQGDGVLVLGPNGTGKTTFLRVLADLLRPSSGEVDRTCKVDLVGHEAMTYDALTARENLSFYARLGGAAPERVGSVLTTVGLTDVADRVVGPFSRGMRQRLALARALLSEPDVLLLDEPFSGLDSEGVETVSSLIGQQRERGGAVVVVSHDLPRSVPVCSSLMVLTHGKSAGPEEMDGDPARVAARYAEILEHD